MQVNTEVLLSIKSHVDWFKSNTRNNDVVEKIQRLEELSTYSWYLAEQVADAHERRNTAEFLYKTSLTSDVVNSSLGVGRAEAQAKHDHKDLYNDLIQAENLYKRLSLLLNQTDVVINQIRQSVSYLKKEKNDN